MTRPGMEPDGPAGGDGVAAGRSVGSTKAAPADRSRLLDATLSSIPDFVYAFDPRRRFVYANPAVLGLFGLSADEMLGRTFADLGYPADLAERLNGHIDRVLREGVTVEDEVFYRSPTGRAAYFAYLWGPVRAPDGSVELVVGVSRDTSERRAFEEALRASEALFRGFADNSSDLIWICDPAEGAIIFRSAAYQRIWGVACPEAPTAFSQWMEDVHPDDRRQVEHALETVKAGEVARFEYRIVRPSDGAVRLLRETSFPILDEYGTAARIGGITEDLTRDDVRQVYIVCGGTAQARRLAGIVRAEGHSSRSFTGGSAFLDVAPVLSPGCVLVDLRKSRRDGLSVLRELKARSIPLPAFAIDAPGADVEAAVAAMKAGAVDYLVLADDPSDRPALAKVVSECLGAAKPVTRDEAVGARIAALTPREREVLVGLVEGGTNKSIANKLGISPRTVELHRAQVMGRLNANSLTELLRLALCAGVAPAGAGAASRRRAG